MSTKIPYSSPIITAKRKLTPLSLYSKLKKNSLISADRQSVLSLIEKQQIKINNRYGEIKQQRKIRTEGNNSVMTSQEIKVKKDREREMMMELRYEDQNKEGEADGGDCDRASKNKIQQILRKSDKKGRFYSVKRRQSERDSSPYLSQSRKKLQLPKNNQQDSSFLQKAKLLHKLAQSSAQAPIPSKSNPQLLQSQPLLQSRQRILPPLTLTNTNPIKILIHFYNLWQIDQILQNKRQQKDILPFVKSYVLSEEGDSSEIQGLYTGAEYGVGDGEGEGDQKCSKQGYKICQDAKKILFLEKVLIIVIVDLIINRKLKLAQIFVKSALKIVIKFYTSVYKDLKKASSGLEIVPKDTINSIKKTQNQSIKILTHLSQSPQSQQQSDFSHIFTFLQSKMRPIFKFSRPIQKFYLSHKKSLPVLNPNLSYFRLLEFYSESLLGTNWINWNIEFLEVCPSPYLHCEPTRKYTLVLDLDETLVHYKMGTPGNNYQGEFLIRPYTFQFLKQMSQYYQLGIFTCSVPEYANLILNHLPSLTFRLYRHHTIRLQGQYIKDLSRLGRDLKKLILIDNLEGNFRLQKNNGIHIRSWYGDRNDQMLKKVSEELRKIAEMGVEDLRKVEFERKFL